MPSDTLSPPLEKVGNYDLLQKIADGGMGSVYKGRHRDTGALVAIKILPPHLAANAVYLKRFEQEYNATKALNHPNIVKAIEFGREGHSPYLVMEFVEGESLGDRIERTGRMNEHEAIRIIGQVAQGLHKAHKLGLIHRDVKPDNIILTPDGHAKLVDMGLVKEVDADLNLTRTNRGLGTPHFMAPEQFRNAKNADVRCDIYSMAATLYMMVTGELPFKSCGPLDAWMKKINNELTPARRLAPNLSERVDWAIRRSMSADPSQRAASCREFVEDLTGHSTRRLNPSAADTLPEDIWYMVYKDEAGVLHTVKGSTNGIRRSLREGLLGDASTIRLSRMKEGPFDPLRNHPEFRDLVVEPAPLPPPKPARPASQTPTLAAPQQDTLIGAPPAPPPASSSSLIMRFPPAPAAPPAPPKIHLGTSEHTSEWLKLLVLGFVAIGVGLIGYFLVPLLQHLRIL